MSNVQSTIRTVQEDESFNDDSIGNLGQTYLWAFSIQQRKTSSEQNNTDPLLRLNEDVIGTQLFDDIIFLARAKTHMSLDGQKNVKLFNEFFDDHLTDEIADILPVLLFQNNAGNLSSLIDDKDIEEANLAQDLEAVKYNDPNSLFAKSLASGRLVDDFVTMKRISLYDKLSDFVENDYYNPYAYKDLREKAVGLARAFYNPE